MADTDRQAAQPPQERPSIATQIWNAARQAIMFYLIMQVAKNVFSPKQPPVQPQPASSDVPASNLPPDQDPFRMPPTSLAPLWPVGTTLDMHVRLSMSPYDPFEKRASQGLPSFVWEDIKFGDWNDERVNEYTIDVPVPVQHNASIFAHIFLTKDHATPDPRNMDTTLYVMKPLTRYLKKPKAIIEKKLLGGNNEAEEASLVEESEPQEDVWLSYWHPNVTLTLVSDPQVIQTRAIAGPTAQFYRRHPTKRDETGKVGFYYPVVFPNDFWLLRGHMSPINDTTPTLPLRISYHAVSTMKFNLYASMTHGFDEAANKGGGATSADLDEIKRMLIETNPWLLIVTAVVSILHMVFEMLAFTSDVAHWRKKEELVGVSVRSIIVNVFVQIITTLYLFDNSQDTSWMILFSQVIGVAIEAWKITKAVDIKFEPAPPGSTLPYKIKITDKHVLSEDEKKTQEYDRLAFRYVSYVAIPLLAGYTIYSLLYESHKGWYSFIISTLTSFVYMFGFVQLVPQLIINYKLKSVAHMPWKAMVYKTLSTVVDDFFAFIIKMPWLHRLACFRDDVVFLILLYQRWIYRVDYSRVNEYGQVAAEKTEKVVEGQDKKE
ncbi:hypothetical protein FRC02_009576 [Tulasnella sp. 418]|nr:hypothetical protein FRC02_009576 [Tulasnella sp. 418]